MEQPLVRAGRPAGDARQISSPERAWVVEAIRKIEADFCRSADTHLLPLPKPGFRGIDVYFAAQRLPPLPFVHT